MKVDFNKPWNDLIGGLPILESIFNVLGIVGVVLVVFALCKWGWDRRRGGSGGFPWMAIIIGAVCAAPKALIPVLLWVASVIASVVVGVAELAQNVF